MTNFERFADDLQKSLNLSVRALEIRCGMRRNCIADYCERGKPHAKTIELLIHATEHKLRLADYFPALAAQPESQINPKAVDFAREELFSRGLASWQEVPFLGEKRAKIMQTGRIPPDLTVCETGRIAHFLGLDLIEFLTRARDYAAQFEKEAKTGAKIEPPTNASELPFPHLPDNHWKNKREKGEIAGGIVDLPHIDELPVAAPKKPAAFNLYDVEKTVLYDEEQEPPKEEPAALDEEESED